jgi:hypothetical protein
VSSWQRWARRPRGNGLGVEIDVPKLAKMAAKTKAKFAWPVVKLADGSIADY